MTISAIPQSEHGWLERFFAPPNEILWSEMRSGVVPPEVADLTRPWLEMLGKNDPDVSVVLPVFEGGKPSRWYAAAQSSLGSVQLGEELRAWFGPSYLTREIARVETPADDLEAAFVDRFGPGTYRLDMAGGAGSIVQRLAAMYAGVIARRPRSASRVVRPVGKIRADFDKALLAGDEPAAVRLLEELRATGRLNEENLRYLDVRLKAGLGYWPQIAFDRALLGNLSDLTLPPQTIADVVEALYRVYLDDIEVQGVASALLAAFKAEIEPRYARLFATRRGASSPRVVKAFLLHELSQPAPSASICASLVEALPAEERSSPVVDELLALAAKARPPENLEQQADDAFDDMQYDRALALYLQLPPSKKSLVRILKSAQDIGTPEAKAQAAEALHAAGSVREQLPASALALAEAFSAPKMAPHAAREAVTGWLAWARRVASGSADEQDVQLARDGVGGWSAGELLSDKASVTEFADLIGNATGTGAVVVRRSIPAIYGAFASAGASAKPILANLVTLIAMDESVSSTDLELIAQLLVPLLGAGLGADEYRALVDEIGEVSDRVASISTMPWALDVCETLALHPAATPAAAEARLRFFWRVVDHARSVAHRLAPDHIFLLQMLAQDFSIDENELEFARRAKLDEAASAGPDLSSKVIGIYTLAEQAGARAKAALEALFPGVKVTVNSDLVCTPQLTSLAKAADIFVFAWRSSSHQAFYCVKNASPRVEPTWAAGKGSASILRAVFETAE